MSGFKDRNINIVLPSEVERIEPDPFISTIEDTSAYEWDNREDSKTHLQDSTKQAHASEYQQGSQDLSPVSRSTRTRYMADKMRESNNSSDVLTSMQQSNEERDNYYDSIHGDNLRMQ